MLGLLIFGLMSGFCGFALARILGDSPEDTFTVKFKKLDPNAKLPTKANPDDAGYDLTAVSKKYDFEKKLVVMGTGLAVEIPRGYVGLIFPRSSICKVQMSLSNSVGVIDAPYRGEIKFMFRPLSASGQSEYQVGDRVGQLIILPIPSVEFTEVTELSETERSDGGFGSSGR